MAAIILSDGIFSLVLRNQTPITSDKTTIINAIAMCIVKVVQKTSLSLCKFPFPNSYEIKRCEVAIIAEFKKANIVTIPPTRLYMP